MSYAAAAQRVMYKLHLMQRLKQRLAVQGEIPTLTELPAPWGPKPYVASAADAAHGPAKYPDVFSPLDDAVKPVLAI